MRAVLLSRHDQDPVLAELPLPEPGPGEVRVAMRACGICGSDLHIIDGSTVPARLPLVLGHEASGVVDALGEGVGEGEADGDGDGDGDGAGVGEGVGDGAGDADRGLQVGDRVTVNPMITCGRCRTCLHGRANLCLNIQILGLHVDGAHGEYFLVPAANLIRLPDAISFSLGAIVADAIGTPMRAIASAGIQAGDTVAVFGLGGLGLHAAMILQQIFGAHVIGVDASDAALDRAGSFGIDTVFDARAGRVANEIRAATGGGVDAAFEFVGSLDVVEQAVRSLGRGGICTVAGVGRDRLNLSLRQESLVAKGLRLVGTHGYLSSDIEQILSWLESGRLKTAGTVSHEFELADYAAGLHALRDRSANAIRVVITNK